MPSLGYVCLCWFLLLKSLQKRCSVSARQVSLHLWLGRTKPIRSVPMQVEGIQQDQFPVRCFVQETGWRASHKRHHHQKSPKLGFSTYWSHNESVLTCLPRREPRGAGSFAALYVATVTCFLVRSHCDQQRYWDREDKEQSSQQHFGVSLLMKETEVSWAGNTHRVSCSNSRGLGKCSFSCIFRTVIKEISAKKICSIQKLSGLSCHSFLGDLILRQVFHNRLNDS